MIPASLIVFAVPLIVGGAAFVLRRWRSLEMLAALLGCAGVIIVLAQPYDGAFLGLIAVGGRLDLLGRSLQVHSQDRSALQLLFLCAAILVAASWRTPENWTFIPVGMISLAAVSISLMVRPFAYAGLAYVIMGALGALMIQAERNGERTTLGATRYLVITVIALPMFLGAGFVAQRAANISDPGLGAAAYAPAIQFLVIGFAMLLGAIPVYTWIHPVARDAPPLTTAFLATVGVGATTFLFLTFVREFDWFRASETMALALWIGGVIFLLGAALLGWAQRSFARVLACAVMLDIGCTLLALTGYSRAGVEAAAFAVFARALSFGLFGIGVALLRERCGDDNFDSIRGTGSREVWLALAIGLGGLSIAGLPGTIGFASRWVSLRALDNNAELMVLMALAGVSVAIGVLRGLIAMFSGIHEPSSFSGVRVQGEQMTVVVGSALVLIFGFLPGLVTPLAQAIAAAYVP